LGFLYLLYEVRDHTKSIRQRIRKIDLVVIIFESVVPAELEVDSASGVFLILNRQVSFHHLAQSVANIFTSELPGCTLFFGFFNAQYLNRHALLVQRVYFGHIYDVYADFGAL